MADDKDFGARFLAELRKLGVTPGHWKYETVMAIERADREQFMELFKRAAGGLPDEVVRLAESEEPAELARRIMATQRPDSVLSMILLSF